MFNEYYQINSYGTAVKTIVSDVLPEGEEPFSERYPDEMIQAIYSPMSIVSRESLYAICVLTHLNLFNCWKVRSVQSATIIFFFVVQRLYSTI